VFTAILSNIKNFLIAKKGFGFGSLQPVQSLADNLPADYAGILQPSGLGPDVATVVARLVDPLPPNKKLIFLAQPGDLLTTCQESLQGVRAVLLESSSTALL
jgi:ATP-binding cassette subfamily A (ABC1) protein 3